MRKNFAPPLLHLVKILKKDEKKYKYWWKNIEKWMKKPNSPSLGKTAHAMEKAIRMGTL